MHFPAWYGSRAESWVLSSTTLRPTRRWGREMLELRAPGRRPRRFLRAGLRCGIDEVIAAVDARR